MRTFLLPLTALTLFGISLLGPGPSQGEEAPRDDGRVASVVAQDGTTLVRPPGHRRWTPLRPEALLFPGDEVRVLTRGAHALELALEGGAGAVLGPGARAVFEQRGRVRLLGGEAEIAASAAAPVELVLPGEREEQIERTTWWRRSTVGTSP